MEENELLEGLYGDWDGTGSEIGPVVATEEKVAEWKERVSEYLLKNDSRSAMYDRFFAAAGLPVGLVKWEE